MQNQSTVTSPADETSNVFVEAVETAVSSDAGYTKGVLAGLALAWPPALGEAMSELFLRSVVTIAAATEGLSLNDLIAGQNRTAVA